MGVNSLPKTVTRQRRDCDLNPDPSAPESSTLTSRLPSQPLSYNSSSLLILKLFYQSLTKNQTNNKKLFVVGQFIQ